MFHLKVWFEQKQYENEKKHLVFRYKKSNETFITKMTDLILLLRKWNLIEKRMKRVKIDGNVKVTTFSFSAKKKLALLLFIFTQDSHFNAYCTVINEGPAIEVLIVYKAPIWATEFTPLNQTTPKESPSVRIPCGFELTSFGKFRLCQLCVIRTLWEPLKSGRITESSNYRGFFI